MAVSLHTPCFLNCFVRGVSAASLPLAGKGKGKSAGAAGEGCDLATGSSN